MIGKNCLNHNLFRHDLLLQLKKNAGLILIGLCVLLVLIPFSTAGIPGNSIFAIATTHDQMKFRFISEAFVNPVYGVVILFSVLLGIHTFCFLLEKKQTTLYFSIGLKREKLFAARYLTGIIGIALVVWLPMTVSFCLNLKALGGYAGELSCYIFVSLGLFLQGMVVYTISILACMFAGTLAETILYDALFLGGFTGITYSVNQLLLHTVWGNAHGAVTYTGSREVARSLSELVKQWNPAVFFLQDTKDYSMFYRGLTQDVAATFSGKILINWGVAIGLLLLLTLFALRKRKAEAAEITGQNLWMTQILVGVSEFCCFCIVYVMFDESSRMLALVFAVLAVLFLQLLWQVALIRTDAKRKALVQGAIQLGIVLLCFGGLSGIGNQVTKQIPDTASIVKAELSYIGNPSYISSETAGSSSGTSYYMTSTNSYENEADIAAIIAIHKQYQKLGMAKFQTNETEFSKTVVPYDIEIRYTLKNGTVKSWYYDRASLELLASMLDLEDGETGKESIRQVITGTLDTGDRINWAEKAYTQGSVYLTNTMYEQPYQLEFTQEARSELLSALAQDVAAQSVEDRYFPAQDAVGVLLFSEDGENDKESFSYHLGNAMVYITSSFTNTLSFLEKNELLYCMKFLGEIESITLQKYDPYGGINGRTVPISNVFLGYRTDSLDDFLVQIDFGKRQPITDPTKLKELIPQLRSTYFMENEGYLAAVKLKGTDGYIYKFLPE